MGINNIKDMHATHKKLWSKIIELQADEPEESRLLLKRRACSLLDLVLKNQCAACDFAEEVSGEEVCHVVCNEYCPLDWGDGAYKASAVGDPPCETPTASYSLWRNGINRSAIDVLNTPLRASVAEKYAEVDIVSVLVEYCQGDILVKLDNMIFMTLKPSGKVVVYNDAFPAKHKGLKIRRDAKFAKEGFSKILYPDVGRKIKYLLESGIDGRLAER